MNTDKDDLIYRYLQGDLTASEEMELAEWLSASAEHRHHLKEMHRLWNVMADDRHAAYDTEAAFRLFGREIAAEDTTPCEAPRTAYRPALWRRAVRIAASVALLAGVGLAAYHVGQQAGAARGGEITMSAPDGSYAHCTLPDGTRLTLLPGSQITYPHDFGQRERRLRLEGEATFDVKHDDKVPFVVRTAHLEVRDLGTTFRCKDFADDDRAEVQLIQGLVDVASPASGQVYHLKPCQQLSIDNKTRAVAITHLTEGSDARHISFEGDDLSHIAKVLGRIYGVHISFRGDILSRGYTFHGKFDPSTQRATDILDILALTNRIHYSESGKHITIW